MEYRTTLAVPLHSAGNHTEGFHSLPESCRKLIELSECLILEKSVMLPCAPFIGLGVVVLDEQEQPAVSSEIDEAAGAFPAPSEFLLEEATLFLGRSPWWVVQAKPVLLPNARAVCDVAMELIKARGFQLDSGWPGDNGQGAGVS